eukprot:TRINITY_DN8414_c0_g1_i1.p2 TRINITY_DN8414_c0_g1~~TRINITY_DN8414_c0_g1_i1.p2  ORF type:complete len:192 (+),score=-6.56 TRINITY_DN8414_c0_g1_i1:380-955(+)
MHTFVFTNIPVTLLLFLQKDSYKNNFFTKTKVLLQVQKKTNRVGPFFRWSLQHKQVIYKQATYTRYIMPHQQQLKQTINDHTKTLTQKQYTNKQTRETFVIYKSSQAKIAIFHQKLVCINNKAPYNIYISIIIKYRQEFSFACRQSTQFCQNQLPFYFALRDQSKFIKLKLDHIFIENIPGIFFKQTIYEI